MKIVVDVFLLLVALYASIGLLFGLYLILVGGTKMDPLLKESKKMIRVLLLPGIAATWPFLLGKLIKSRQV